ncbi:hypothetical protein INN71_03535 [Nocardioides sp. ChNu-153]|uniref:YchJ family protein n=1 Tax=unclassified Nocardioides TaxID=2615069 RepID=UPI0024053E19|nr:MULTISPECIES: YchJ family metal-binding protein [unclassified Nocardioides]MDF9717470.1 hypothetical protein [Nocardioides sp. ChNu-99]MDN7120460.1 hypothetical protein [Nocardioides sp. ChNu-153]
MDLARPCPCGLPATYDACCGRLLRGAAVATTAEELMRSRYTAHVIGGREGADHLFRSWHPRTRPDDVTPDPATTWTGLEVLEAVAGGADDTDGVVAFAAHHAGPGGAGVLRERSRFTRRAGRWVYVDGDVEAG